MLLGAKEVAGILGCGERQARRMMVSGSVESFRQGRRGWRTTREKVAEHIAREFSNARELRIRARVASITDLRVAK